MAHWKTFQDEAPDLAPLVEARFTAHLHHILGTLRSVGSPRLSGTELHLYGGDAWLGSMPDSQKGQDLRRDPRFTVHSAPIDTKLVHGDAKLSGLAMLETDERTRQAVARLVGREDGELGGDLFRLDLAEATLTRVMGDRLVVDTWRPGQELRHVERS